MNTINTPQKQQLTAVNSNSNPDISDKSTNPSDKHESSCLINGDMQQVVQT
jgi:hypothetical protein